MKSAPDEQAVFEALAAAILKSTPADLTEILRQIAEARAVGLMLFDGSLLFQASRRHGIAIGVLAERYDSALKKTGLLR